MMGAVIEVGPAAIRRLHPLPELTADQELTRKALCGLDDSMVLVDELPTDVDSLLQSIVQSVGGGDCDSLTLVFPSGWRSSHRDRIVGAARVVTKSVAALGRATLIVECDVVRFGAMVLVEFSYSHVTISVRADVVAILERPTTAECVRDEVVSSPDITTIYLDIPPDIEAGTEAAELEIALVALGFSVVYLDMNATVNQHFRCEQPADVRIDTRRWRAHAQLIVAGCVLAAFSVAAVMSSAGAPVLPAGTQQDSTDLIEGSVAVKVPTGWMIERITAGPGSRRVRAAQTRAAQTRAVQTEASDIHLGDNAIHITQSYGPGQQLTDIATTLERIVKAQAAGTFTDFSADNSTFGRSTVAYRELRNDRIIRWFVFMDGSTRIGIGCQSAVGDEHAIDVPCGVAIRSAHEVRGAG